MRHLVSGRKLNRTASHRRAMLSDLAISILDKERVTTTLAKAKEVRSVVERLITYGKQGGLHAIRMASRRINDKAVLKKLFDDIGPSFKDREGGYTRIIKIGERKGDNAPMSIIELVGRGGTEAVRKRKRKPKAKAAPQAAGATEQVQSAETAAPSEASSEKSSSETEK